MRSSRQDHLNFFSGRAGQIVAAYCLEKAQLSFILVNVKTGVMMDLEEQVRLHKELSLKIDELEEQKKALGQSILQAMSSKSIQLGPYVVKRMSRLSISLTLDEARPFNAIKLEEVVDKDKIKALYKEGTQVPGVKELEYIQVTHAKTLAIT